MASSATSDGKFLLLKNVVVSSEFGCLKGSPTFMAESLAEWEKFIVESRNEAKTHFQNVKLWRFMSWWKINQICVKQLVTFGHNRTLKTLNQELVVDVHFGA